MGRGNEVHAWGSHASNMNNSASGGTWKSLPIALHLASSLDLRLFFSVVVYHSG